MDKSKLIKMFALLGAIFLLTLSLRKLILGDSLSLTDYAERYAASDEPTSPPEDSNGTDTLNTSDAPKESASPDSDPDALDPEQSPSSEEDNDNVFASSLTGASLNGVSQLEQRYTLQENFYYEPLSDNLRRYITGVSYPAQTGEGQDLAITLDELCYVHILHYDFDGNPKEGELICNQYIAQDLVEIFYELFRNEYQLERVLLIDEYDGSDAASMEDNNTSCFNYRLVNGTTSLSKHALGLAIDVNPLYNPYVSYNSDGSLHVSPAVGEFYADRSASFPYKIDENDLCYKLFTQHGFTWGGNWNSIKDYQHFQKPIN